MIIFIEDLIYSKWRNNVKNKFFEKTRGTLMQTEGIWGLDQKIEKKSMHGELKSINENLIKLNGSINSKFSTRTET